MAWNTQIHSEWRATWWHSAALPGVVTTPVITLPRPSSTARWTLCAIIGASESLDTSELSGSVELT